MSISNKDIQSAMRAKLITIGGIPDSDHRAWENKSFSPTNGKPWIRENHLPAEERLSANNELRQTGLFQYDYFVPIGHSIFAAKDVADAVKHAFKPTTVVDGLVRIEQSQVLRGRKDPDNPAWYHLPIEISYTVFGNNN